MSDDESRDLQEELILEDTEETQELEETQETEEIEEMQETEETEETEETQQSISIQVESTLISDSIENLPLTCLFLSVIILFFGFIIIIKGE